MCTPAASNDILLPYQREWILDRSPVKIAEKSRRTGLTWATALEAVIVASSAPSDGGQDVYFMTYAEDDAKEFIRDAAKFAEVLGVLCGEVWVDEESGKGKTTVKILVIEFAGGFRIHALAGRPRKFRGKQGFAVIDEAAFVDDLEGLMKAATAFLMWGGRIALISTHLGESNHFNTLLCSARDGTQPDWTVHSIPLAEAIEQGLARRICTLQGEPYTEAWAEKWEADLRRSYGEAAAEELDCVPSRQGAGYFDPESVARCRTQGPKVIRWQKQREWFDLHRDQRAKECDAWIEAQLMPALRGLNTQRGCFLGIDYGRFSDLACFALAQMHGTVRRVEVVLELRNIPQAQQEQILRAFMTHTPRLGQAAIDKTGNGQALYEWGAERYGSQIEGFTLGPKWHDESWPEVRKGITERHIDLPDDDEICDDFRLVELIDGKPRVAKRRQRTRGGYRHGDAAVAICLMYSVSKAGGAKITSAKVPKIRKRRGF